MKSGDKIFLYIAVIIGITVISIMATNLSEDDKKSAEVKAEDVKEHIEDNVPKFPMYLYVDRNGCYHKSLDCFHLNPQMSDFGYLIDNLYTSGEGNYAVVRHLIYDLTADDIVWTCSGCISDNDYEDIMQAIHLNKGHNWSNDD